MKTWMKRIAIPFPAPLRHLLFATVLLIFGASGWVISQQPPAPVPEAAIADQSAQEAKLLQALEALRAGNQELLERQQALMKRLEVLEEEARQLRIFARRS